jgi:queuine tRNA-ribosyltransferase
VRNDPERLAFEIQARDGAARTGRLLTAHGEVETPAFIPLATRGSVRSLAASDVAELGYRLILGNTFHLMLAPGEGRIATLGGLRRFMGWERSVITDSGGFQVFSLAHGTVADEIKGRRGQRTSRGSVIEIAERGVRFRSYVDGSERFLSPEESMRIQAALGSLFGIVQGGVYDDLRRESAQRVAAAAVDGVAIGGTLGRDKPQMYGVLEMTVPHLPDEAPRHLLGIGEPDDLVEGISRGIDLFDCAVPTRLARHGMALAPLPFRFDVRRAGYAEDQGPLVEGCRCPACVAHTRAYIHYLSRQQELTAVRLLTLHNLSYLHDLVAGARAAIRAGRLGAYREGILGGAAPWALKACGRG